MPLGLTWSVIALIPQGHTCPLGLWFPPWVSPFPSGGGPHLLLLLLMTFGPHQLYLALVPTRPPCMFLALTPAKAVASPNVYGSSVASPDHSWQWYLLIPGSAGSPALPCLMLKEKIQIFQCMKELQRTNRLKWAPCWQLPFYLIRQEKTMLPGWVTSQTS